MKIRVVVAGMIAALLVMVVWVGLGSAQPSAKRAKALAPIVLGSLCDCSGSISSSGGGWTAAMNVWAAYTNAHGGILGHKVKLISRDTQSSSTVAVTDAQELLNQDKVVALFPGGSVTSTLQPTINAAKAPIIGGQGTDILSSVYYFPVTTSYDNILGAIVKVGGDFSPQHPVKGGYIYCVEVPSCALGLPTTTKLALASGQQAPFSAAISGSAPNYTAQCLAAQSAGVTWIFGAVAASELSRLIDDCATQNYKPIWVAPQFDISFLSDPNLTKGNMVAISTVAPYDSPAAKPFLTAVAKYAPGIIAQPSFGPYSFQAWISGQLLVAALEKAKPTGSTITRADVFKGIYMLHNETLGGETGPLTFKKGSQPNNPCFFVAVVKGGKLTQKGGSKCVK